MHKMDGNVAIDVVLTLCIKIDLPPRELDEILPSKDNTSLSIPCLEG